MTIDEPTTCPTCGSTDLAVFAATPEREDEADLVECEACPWTAALTPQGADNLALAALREAFNESVEMADGEAVEAYCILSDAVAAFLGAPDREVGGAGRG